MTTRASTPTIIATDGSCLSNPGGATGWSWVSRDGRYHHAGTPVGTNQTAELWGVIAALRDNPTGDLVIQVDSEYVLNIATKWGSAWERSGWTTRDGKPVKNAALVKMLLRLLRARNDKVSFVKVPGHDPRNRWPLNTVADQLAQYAAKASKHASADFEEEGQRAPFMGAVEPAKGSGDGSAPGERCGSCNAIIRDVSPHCRCDLS